MKSEAIELLRVTGVGTAGLLATIKLQDVATFVSILVGLATLTYVCAKTYFLIRNNGNEPKP